MVFGLSSRIVAGHSHPRTSLMSCKTASSLRSARFACGSEQPPPDPCAGGGVLAPAHRSAVASRIAAA